MTNILYSGGAKGADTLFYERAKAAGHQVQNFSFEGHSTKCGDLVVLTKAQLKYADPYLEKANKILKRNIDLKNKYENPKTEYVNNLLRRNFYQIKDTEDVYAVTWFNKHKNLIEGGTGWAVYMAIQKRVRDVFVYDQSSEGWIQWVKIQWMPIIQPPKPQGKYTGIGSRELTPQGIAAIEKLYTL